MNSEFPLIHFTIITDPKNEIKLLFISKKGKNIHCFHSIRGNTILIHIKFYRHKKQKDKFRMNLLTLQDALGCGASFEK